MDDPDTPPDRPAPAPVPPTGDGAPGRPDASARALWGEVMTVPRAARLLGLAGLLPMLAAALAAWAGGPGLHYAALALAHAYGALILSFLGGMWWGLAARADTGSAWPYMLAVAPSLLALATFVPWAVGGAWPVPSLVVISLALWFSPLVDRRLDAAGLVPPWWMALRWPLSIGLAVLTLLTVLGA